MTNTDERPACRWSDNRRLLATHERDCNASGCEGCEPCPLRHCRCGRHLDDGQLRCERCVGRVRTDLKRITDLCQLVPLVAAALGAINSEAVSADGPVPRHSTQRARQDWVMTGALCRCAARDRVCPDLETIEGPPCASATCGHYTCERINGCPVCPDLRAWLDQADDTRHPLWVLGTWDIAVTEHLEHGERTMRVTVSRAAAYLDANLTDLARHEDFGFDEMASEIATCRAYVEQVLSVAAYEQRGAPCPACGKAQLVKHHGHTALGDHWRCPKCAQQWSDQDYRIKVDGIYLGVADRLTASQIAEQYRVTEPTIRKWAEREKVRRRGKDDRGRVLYDVADVLACRDGKRAS